MITITGIFRGIKTVPSRDPSRPHKVFAGIACNKSNGYAGEEQIQDVRLTKEQIASGFAEKLNGFQDKQLTLPIFIVGNAWKERAYIEYYCAGDPLGSIAGQPPTLKKAV